MSPQALIAFVASVSASFVAVKLASRSRRVGRITSRTARALVVIVLGGLAALLALFVAGHVVFAGPRLCFECGQIRRAVSILGVNVGFSGLVRPAPDARASDESQGHERSSDEPAPRIPAYAELLPRLHRMHLHAWETIGCQRSLMAVHCLDIGAARWFSDLPRVRDRARARAAAEWLSKLPRAERRRVVASYDVEGSHRVSPDARFADWCERQSPPWK